MKKSKTACLFLKEYALSDVELGSGAYSEVFSATRKNDGLKVAVKVVKSVDLTSLRNEVKIMKLLLPNQVRKNYTECIWFFAFKHHALAYSSTI